MAESKIVAVRLGPDELDMLAKVKLSEVRGDLNNSEMVRLLVRREYERRFGGGQVKAAQYSSAFRVGRPKDQPDLPCMVGKGVSIPVEF